MSVEKKRELQVAALENGTAIDHIPPSQLFKVAKLLGLENMDNTITIGNNFQSKKMGCKGVIKISNITNNEPMPSRFEVIDKEKGTIKCRYCERKINKEDIIIK